MIKELNFLVHNTHVLSVINILIDEIMKDLLLGKEIRLINFGSLKLKKMKQKKFKNVLNKKIELSKARRALRFTLSKRVKNFLKLKSYENMRKSVELCDKKQEL